MDNYRMVVAESAGKRTKFGCELVTGDGGTALYVLWALVGDHWMDWEVHEALGECDGEPIFQLDEHQRNGHIDVPADGSLLMQGMVKWDGCTQWSHYNDSWHYDHCDDVPDVKAIVGQVWDIAEREMPAWDRNGCCERGE